MLSTHDLVVSYGGATVLGPLSVSFPAGKLSVLLGPSGAGKTSLLRSLAHLGGAPGAVRVDGRPLDTGALLSFRRSCGLVFQEPRLVERWSALRNVLLGARRRHGLWRSLLPAADGDRRAALRALDEVGLLALAERRADALSGGERQRVALARALAWSPQAILADEPIASLDPTTGSAMLALLRARTAAGATAVVSLHQVEPALAAAEHVVVLARGRVAYAGAPDALDRGILAAVYADSHQPSGDSHATSAPPARDRLPDLHPLPRVDSGCRRA